MIEETSWEVIKSVTSWLWVPIGAIITWLVRDYTTHKGRITNLEKRVAVLESQHSDMRQDLSIIREGVDRLVSHLLLNKK